MSQEDLFLEAFDRHADALYRHCYFRVSDKEKARDLVSDAFARTWDYVVKGNEIEDFKPFLYRTVNHLIIDEYRRKKSDSLDTLLNEHEVPEAAFPELVEGGLDEVEFSLDAKRLPSLLRRMPETYREVVVMRYVDGLEPREIAELMDVSVNVVSVRIHRGIQWLRNHFDTPNT